MDWLEQLGWSSAALYKFRSITGFFGHVFARIANDRLMRVAAGLSYTSLLSAVPMLTIAFSVFSAFPMFEQLRGDIESLVFDNFAPHAGDMVSEQLSGFIANAGQMTTVGVVALAVTALMTLITVENTLNQIWRVQTPRGPVQRLVMYWTLLTLGPLLLGMSLSVSSVVFAQSQIQNVAENDLVSPLLSRGLPFFLQTMAFTILYLMVPNHHVRKTDALVGGLVAGVLFALLKMAFGWYVSNFPSYQTIYGALSTIPLFMIWMYLAWAVVLLGAEVAASLPEWRSRQVQDIDLRELNRPGNRMTVALLVLEQLWQQSRKDTGGALKQSNLEEAAGSLGGILWQTLSEMQRQGLVHLVDDDGWVLSRDLTALTISELVALLDMDWREEDMIPLARLSWGHHGRAVLMESETARRNLLDRPVVSLWQ